MANISLQHISQLSTAYLTKTSTLDNKYLLISQPFTAESEFYQSRKLHLSSLINTISGLADDNVDSHVERSLRTFVDTTLSGAISTVLSDLLLSSRVVVTDNNGRLTYATITTSELGRLKDCTVDLTASLNSINTNVSNISDEISTYYPKRTETESYTDAYVQQLSAELTAVDKQLSDSISSILLSIDAIGTAYVTNDDIQDGLNNISGELTNIISSVSSDLTARLNEVSGYILDQISQVRNELSISNKNIQFILDYMNVGIKIISSYYDDGWKEVDITDYTDSIVNGCLVQLDSADEFVNESYLLIGFGTPTENGIDDLSVIDDRLSDINVSSVLSAENALSIDIGNGDPYSQYISWNDGHNIYENHWMAPEQLIFLNVN